MYHCGSVYHCWSDCVPLWVGRASQAHRLHEYGGYRAAAAAAASPTVPGPPPDSRAANLPSAQLKKHQFFGKRYFQGADGKPT